MEIVGITSALVLSKNVSLSSMTTMLQSSITKILTIWDYYIQKGLKETKNPWQVGVWRGCCILEKIYLQKHGK